MLAEFVWVRFDVKALLLEVKEEVEFVGRGIDDGR